MAECPNCEGCPYFIDDRPGEANFVFKRMAAEFLGVNDFSYYFDESFDFRSLDPKSLEVFYLEKIIEWYHS